MRHFAIALVFLGLLPVRARGLDIPGDTSSCGIVVSRGDPGVLQGDLDCSGISAVVAAVVLNPGATLYLNGHSITGAWVHDVSCYAAVSPSRTCTIVGPGELTGATFGIAAASRARVENVVIHGNDVGIWKIYGDVSHAARLDLDNVVIRDNVNEGVRGGGGIWAKDSEIRDNGGVGTTSYGPSRLVRTKITGNGGAGIVTGRYDDFYHIYFYTHRLLALVDSEVTGNGLLDGSPDILSGRKPLVKRTTCGTSGDPTEPGNPTWGVCAGD